MDYLEIMNFCGYDLEKANAMANQTDTKSLSEIIEDIMRETGLERGDTDVLSLQSESCRL